MNARSHLAIAAACSLGVTLATRGRHPLQAVAVAGLASLLPDLDNPHSTLGRLTMPLPLLLRAGKGARHRGWLHSAFAAAGAWWLAGKLGLPALAVGTGWLSHVLADSLTGAGTPFFWPLPIRLRVPLVGFTGSKREAFVAMAALGTTVWLGLKILSV